MIRFANTSSKLKKKKSHYHQTCFCSRQSNTLNESPEIVDSI